MMPYQLQQLPAAAAKGNAARGGTAAAATCSGTSRLRHRGIAATTSPWTKLLAARAAAPACDNSKETPSTQPFLAASQLFSTARSRGSRTPGNAIALRSGCKNIDLLTPHVLFYKQNA